MIKLNKEGYYFISNSNIKYELLEGVSIGGERQYTSDVIFIMLADENYLEKVDNHFVNYWMGANFLCDYLEEYDKDISDLVTKYEKENGIYLNMHKRILKRLEDKLIIDGCYMEQEDKKKLLEEIQVVKDEIKEREC